MDKNIIKQDIHHKHDPTSCLPDSDLGMDTGAPVWEDIGQRKFQNDIVPIFLGYLEVREHNLTIKKSMPKHEKLVSQMHTELTEEINTRMEYEMTSINIPTAIWNKLLVSHQMSK